MARYRKIDPRIWNDARFWVLSDAAKLIFLLLLTHPHMTALGAMRVTLAGLAAELGWLERRFRRAFGEIIRLGMVRHDEQAALIWLPNFLKYNAPENPNVVRSWQASLDLLPECGLKDALMHACRCLVERLPKGFAEGLPEPFRKGMANQEQEQEPEPEQEQEQSSPPPTPSTEEVVVGASTSVRDNPAAWPSPEALVTLFNAETPASMPNIRTLSPARRKKAGQVLALFPDAGFWHQVMIGGSSA
jgi:hypothetical protein